jgi:hypothetical protein
MGVFPSTVIAEFSIFPQNRSPTLAACVFYAGHLSFTCNTPAARTALIVLHPLIESTSQSGRSVS